MTLLAIPGFAAAVALGTADRRPVRPASCVLRPALQLRALRAGADRRWHGPAPCLRRAQPGRAGARSSAGGRRGCWLAAAVIFLGWMLRPVVGDQLLRAEVGYAGATALLVLALALLYRQGAPSTSRAQSALDRRGDRAVGLGGIARRRRSPSPPRTARPRLTATRARAGIDAPVDLDRYPLAHQCPHAREACRASGR